MLSKDNQLAETDFSSPTFPFKPSFVTGRYRSGITIETRTLGQQSLRLKIFSLAQTGGLVIKRLRDFLPTPLETRTTVTQ